MNREVENPNVVTVVGGFDSFEAAKAMTESPKLKEAMDKADVTGAPRIEYYEEVEPVTY